MSMNSIRLCNVNHIPPFYSHRPVPGCRRHPRRLPISSQKYCISVFRLLYMMLALTLLLFFELESFRTRLAALHNMSRMDIGLKLLFLDILLIKFYGPSSQSFPFVVRITFLLSAAVAIVLSDTSVLQRNSVLVCCFCRLSFPLRLSQSVIALRT